MLKNRIYKMTLAAVAVILFCAASQMQGWLNKDRSEMGLTRLPPLKNAPPMLAFTTVALGGFRGLIANALWMRATDLQENDKFYEMAQLADWITELEPHFTQVWTVQAWNMAYNISVKFKEPEDRWHWLERGIILLRDRGIPLNPDSALLYRELSWLFQHKMGQNLDDAHMLYKLRWAQEMEKVVGARPDYEALENPKTPQEKERARVLREVYKMDPKVMQTVDELYGPFDWRLPDAHAVYWPELYREHAKPNAADTDTLRRSIFQTMRMDCFRGGALSPMVTNVTEQNFMLWPNLDLVPKISAIYEKMIAEQPELNFQNAHKNFLREAIPLLYVNGRIKEAAQWFAYMKSKYPKGLPDKQANISLRDYVLGEVNTNNKETDMNLVQANLVGMETSAYVCMVRDNDDVALNYQALAQDVWDHYREKIGDMGTNRLGLKPLSEIKQEVLVRMFNASNSPLDRLDQAKLLTKLGLKSLPMAPAPAATTPPVPQ